MTFELSLLLKITVLLGAGLIAVRFARRTRASRRHLVLACTFAAVAGLPLAAAFGPAVSVPLPIAYVVSGFSRTATAPNIAPPVTPLSGAVVTLPVLAEPVVESQPTRRPSPSLATIARGLWALGAAGLFAALSWSLVRVRGLRRSGVPWIAGQAIADEMAVQAGIRRPVTVLLHQRVTVPATIGIFQPAILLPFDAPRWTGADLRRAFVHELEHVRRADCGTRLVARVVCAVYWFHPLIWIAWRQLGIEAERACDDAVVAETDRTEYAEQLVALAARISTAQPHMMSSMANRSDLSVRVRAILNSRQRRGRPGIVATASIVAIVALSVGTVASLRAVAAPRPAGSPTNRSTASIEPAVEVHETAAPAAVPSPAPAPARRPALPEPQTPAAPPVVEIKAIIVTTPEDYVIGPDDVLSVTVFRQPELSREVVVRHDGKISLPLANEIMAAGATPEQLRVRLTERLGLFVERPQVTVAVQAINSRKVFVVGEVVRPGVVPLSESMTVLQAIAMAGGLNPFAKKDSLFIMRIVDGKSVRLPFNYTALLAGQGPDQNITLRRGDTLVVP
jgi:polysaccharide export outer membrane protein